MSGFVGTHISERSQGTEDIVVRIVVGLHSIFCVRTQDRWKTSTNLRAA